jgi:hypothetical protein
MSNSLAATYEEAADLTYRQDTKILFGCRLALAPRHEQVDLALSCRQFLERIGLLLLGAAKPFKRGGRLPEKR